MQELILILILLGDPGAEDLGKGLAAEFVRRGGPQVQVLVGAEARADLEKRGVTLSDLLVAPNIGAHLTAQPVGKGQAPIVLHVDRRLASGDIVVETRAWFDGKSEKHVAIVGKGTDPVGAVTAGVIGLIGHRLPGAAPTGKAAAVDDVKLAHLAERGQWLDLLGLLAGVVDRTPRQRYYEVLAYSKLGQRDPAVEALNKLRAAAPDHFLIAAAEELIPPAGDQPKTVEPDEGGNELRDAPAPADDHSNVLR